MYHETIRLDKKAIGLRLYKLFLDSPHSNEEIAEHLGLRSPQVTYDWFRGEKLPCTERLVNISLFFGVSIESILL